MSVWFPYKDCRNNSYLSTLLIFYVKKISIFYSLFYISNEIFWRIKAVFPQTLFHLYMCWSESCHLQKKEQTNCCIRTSHIFIYLWIKLIVCSSFWRWSLSVWNTCKDKIKSLNKLIQFSSGSPKGSTV